MIGIGLLGLGTVGTGVVEILEKRQEEIYKLTGHEIKIKKILVKDKDKIREIELDKNLITTDYKEIIDDKDIDIIVEVTGDLESSYYYIKEALNNNKHIVTANKAVVSKHFEELSTYAEKKNLAFLYEASVGGGIPILKPLKEQLDLNDIAEVQGILNGTCNYILTRMFNEGLDYDEVLKIAQDLGYAEADPSADVEGHDTLRKLRILGTLALKGKIGEEDILLKGIERITSFDIRQIKMMNSTIKLLGEVKELEDGFIALVQPTIVNTNSYFANVNYAFNSISFKGNNVGELKFYGSGAGKLPTANAVLSDILDIVLNSHRKGNHLGEKNLVNLNEELKGEYYLRVSLSTEEIYNALFDISKRVLTTKDNIAVVTKEIKLRDIIELLSRLNVNKEDYFIARILD